MFVAAAFFFGRCFCAEAGDLYDYEIIAQTDATFVSFGEFPSIADDGTVAFVGRRNDGGDGIYIGTGTGMPLDITAPYSVGANPFGRAVQINNNHQVVAENHVATFGTRIYRWDTTLATPPVQVAAGGSAGSDDFAEVFELASINNSGQVAFAGRPKIRPGDSILGTPNGAGFNTATFSGLNDLRPMIADSGQVVVRVPGASSTRVRMYANNLQTFTTIANASVEFTELGQSTGVSDDGQIVVFYGDLSPAGAATFNVAQPKTFARLSPGPGIFASIRRNTGSPSRVIQRLAGITGNGVLDPNEVWNDVNLNHKVDVGEDQAPDGDFDGNPDFSFTGFSPTARVAVNANLSSSQRGVTCVYMVTDGTDAAIYSSRIYFFNPGVFDSYSPTAIGVEFPGRVAKVGQTLAGAASVLGTIQNLNIFDPINIKGDVAFWVSFQGGAQAILRARRKAVQNGFLPDSPTVQQIVPTTYKGTRKGLAINQIILHATAGSEQSTIKEFTAGARKVSTQYLVSRQGRVTEMVSEAEKANHAPPVSERSIGIELVDDCDLAGNSCVGATGHERDLNWATEPMLRKAAMLAREICVRRGILAKHLTLASPGPFEALVTESQNNPPRSSQNGIGFLFSGILRHGQVYNRTPGKHDPSTAYFSDVAFMTRVHQGIGAQLTGSADLLITDPAGKRVGVLSPGQVINEIPNAEFTGAGTTRQVFSIPSAIDGNYSYRATPTTPGSATLRLWISDCNSGLVTKQVPYLFAQPATFAAAQGSLTYILSYSSTNADDARLTGGANLPPFAGDDLAVTDRNVPVVIDVLGNDSDADGVVVPSTVTIAAAPTNGMATVNPTSGQITYLPATNFVGTDAFTYSVLDNEGAFANEAIVTVRVSDMDGDGIPDFADNCPLNFNPGQEDFDHDGIGDECDNCITLYNPDQANTNGEGSGDACQLRFLTVMHLPDGSAQLSLLGEPGGRYNIEVSTNLLGWFLLRTFTNSSGTYQFTDVTATNFPSRFYRSAWNP